MSMRAIVLFSALASAGCGGGGEAGALFDGKTLDGWRGASDLWRVEGGAIVGETRGDLAHNSYLINDGDYGDFVLDLDFKLHNLNSGIQFHSGPRDDSDDPFFVTGPQADIAADAHMGTLAYEPGGQVTGTDVAALAAVLRPGDWNHYRVEARGPRVILTVNDLVTVDDADGAACAGDPPCRPAAEVPARGFFALQLHKGDAMIVEYRNIVVATP